MGSTVYTGWHSLRRAALFQIAQTRAARTDSVGSVNIRKEAEWQ